MININWKSSPKIVTLRGFIWNSKCMKCLFLKKWYYSLTFFINLSIEIFALKLWLFENDELILSLKCFLIEIFTWEINGNSVTHKAKVTNMWKVIYIWNSNLYLNTGINEKSVFLWKTSWKPSLKTFLYNLRKQLSLKKRRNILSEKKFERSSVYEKFKKKLNC